MSRGGALRLGRGKLEQEFPPHPGPLPSLPVAAGPALRRISSRLGQRPSTASLVPSLALAPASRDSSGVGASRAATGVVPLTLPSPPAAGERG